MDPNSGNIISDTTITPEYTIGGEVKNKDGYTFGLFYDMEMGKLTVSPHFLISRNKTTQNPITIGTDLSYKLGDFNFFGGFGYTQSDDDNSDYNGYIFRIGSKGKLGPGSFKFFYDNGQIDDNGGSTNDYSYFWLSYAINIVNTDLGNISIAPTWRRYVKDVNGVKNYTRDKIELALNIKLK